MVCQGHPNLVSFHHKSRSSSHQRSRSSSHQHSRANPNYESVTSLSSALRLDYHHEGGGAPHSVLASSAPLSRPKYTAVIKCLVSECHQTSRLRRSSIYSRNLFSSSLGLNVISEIRFIAFVIFIR